MALVNDLSKKDIGSRFFVYTLKYLDSGVPYYVGYGQYPRPRKSNERLLRQNIVGIQAKSSLVEYIFCDSEKEAIEKENLEILKLGRIDLGTGILVNRTNGKGSLGIGKRSDLQTRRSKENLGQKTEEQKRLLSLKMRGNTYGRFLKGRKLPEEQKNKMSLTIRRRALTRTIYRCLVLNRIENV